MVVEDIMAVVQVVVEKKANMEYQEEDQQTKPGPGPSTPQPATESLEFLYLELGSANAPGCIACPQLRQKF